MKAQLVLEDGTSLSGLACGPAAERIGRLVMNTAVVGYQEMLTDPANAGRILLLTYPLIGNYGTAERFNQSGRAWAAGLAVKEVSRIYSNWQAQQSLPAFALEKDVPVLSQIDTRTLAVHLRQKGEMLAILSTCGSSARELQAKLKAYKTQARESLLPQISVRGTAKPQSAKGIKTVVLDLGATRAFVSGLTHQGFCCALAGYDTSAEQVLKLRPKAVVVSGGPEEDPGLEIAVKTVAALAGRVPLLGVATGHQVLARALGCRVSQMKLGHHGVNYPVHHAPSKSSAITVQNHSLVVDTASVCAVKGLRVTGYNLNDRTVEEIESARLRCLGVQYDPGAAVYARFKKLIERSR